jgi:hypothetical protein
MRLDAWAAQQQQQAQQTTGQDFIPGYDPDEDPLYDINWKPDYHADLQLASQSYWTQETGSPTPPLPTYQQGTLGRMVDVYGCQAMMRSARHQYQSRLYASIMGVVASTVGLAAAGAEGVAGAIIFALFIGAPLILWRRYHYNQIYRCYFYAQEKILKTGKPVWVPFSRGDLRRIRNTQGPIWP